MLANTGKTLVSLLQWRHYSFCLALVFLGSSSQYHVLIVLVLVLVLVVPELLSEFEFFGFIGIPYVTIGLLRVNLW